MLNKIEQEIKEIILNFVDKNKTKIFIFGSRALGNEKKYSDYDIGIESSEKLSFQVIARIKTALEDSELPFKVDVVDFLNVSDDFKKEALKKIKNL